MITGRKGKNLDLTPKTATGRKASYSSRKPVKGEPGNI